MSFVVDVAPGRGPDGGRDLVVSEQLHGTLFSNKFTWLVSCKQNAKKGNAVGAEEVDITDRCKRNGAQGFIGFYSTMASSGLIDRLVSVRELIESLESVSRPLLNSLNRLPSCLPRAVFLGAFDVDQGEPPPL
jgi:hypothetical protein